MAKKPRYDQPGIPEIGDEYNKRVHSAAKTYVRLRDARMEATRHEDGAKQKLIEIMHEEAIDTYSHKDVDVTLQKGDDNVKVKIGDEKKPAKKDEPEEGEE